MIDSNELTRKIKTPLNPRAALIAYASEGDKNFFLEIRGIDDRGNMTEGRPVTLEFMNTLVKEYSERHGTTPYGKIPDNLLYCDSRKGSERYVWYNPPHKRMMFFSTALKIENAEYYLPGVIYEAGEHGMRIYAYKGNVPRPDTVLYAAPFFNVTGSSVCLGNARIELPKDLTYEKLLQYWERKFWLTEFTHLGGNGNPTRSNLVLVAKAARDRDFNLDELKQLNNMKLKDILKMKRVHYIDNYLINPQHPVTVNLIGAGGTGSQVLPCLARLDTALRGLGHPGLFVTLYDSDIVTEANIGRQLFSPSDIGLNKAQCLVTRMNNFFGNDWKAVPDIYPAALKDARRDNLANIMITCTDNIKSRLDLWNILKAVPVSEYRSHETPLYWMDFGNMQNTGQVILGTVPKKIRQPASKLYETVESLKVITRYVKYARVKEKDSGPSCSLAEALEKQDLFINSTLAQLGCNILWKMFRNGMIEHHGLYLNLSTMKVNPITV